MCVHNGKYQMIPANNDPLDCACVIHGDGYTWDYVDRLYSMLCRHLSRPVKLHVYTEADRPVPAHMIKHVLADLHSSGAVKSWWHKLQLFNPAHHCGPLLYFDLDTVITKNIDWIWQLNLRYFWAVRDFKYLWKNNCTTSNTSVMWWNTEDYTYVWNTVTDQGIDSACAKYRGDQDFVSAVIPQERRRFFNTDWVKSWRWQALNGGFNFSKRKYLAPDTGTVVDADTGILVFHGHPKPHEISDTVVLSHWQ